MADEKRRELRRRRILENSEARREKIFGITKSKNTLLPPDAPDPSATPAFATSTPLPVSDTDGLSPVPPKIPIAQTVLETPLVSKEEYASSYVLSSKQDLLSNGDDPNLVQELLSNQENAASQIVLNRSRKDRNVIVNDSILSRSGNYTLESSFDPPTEHETIKLDQLGVYPCMLGILVCFFLTVGLGNVVFNSLIVPFVLFELNQFLWQSWQRHQNGAEGKGEGLLGVAIVLCGIPQRTVRRLMVINNVVQTLGADFAVYLVTSVLWQVIIGLPTVPYDSPAHEFTQDTLTAETANL